jgi:hypothetical protein
VDPDRFIGRLVIPGHQLLNQSLGALSQITLLATMAEVAGSSSAVIAANDPNLDPANLFRAGGYFSACLLERAHLKEAGVSTRAAGLFESLPLGDRHNREDDKVARAKRSMAKISNATRIACDSSEPGSRCARGWITDRRPEQLVPIPSNWGVLRSLIGTTDWKWGQTKLLSYGFSVRKADGRNYLRDWRNDLPHQPISDLAQGDSLGSDDIYRLKLGPAGLRVSGLPLVNNPLSCRPTDNPLTCWGDPRQGADPSLPFANTVKPSIWALSDAEIPGGLHYRVVTAAGVSGSRPDDLPNSSRHGEVGLNSFEKPVVQGLLTATVYVANVRPIADGNHPWQGLARFAHFEPGQYQGECGGEGSLTDEAQREAELNQPSTWVALNKTRKQLLNPRHDTTGAGTNKPALIDPDSGRLTVENSRKVFLGTDGLHVISRGQSYYHRPGNWAEQPNFFNPYWKPRLASVWQGRHSFPWVEQLVEQLPAPMADAPPKVLTH